MSPAARIDGLSIAGRLVRLLPIILFAPFRRGAVSRRRGSLVRKVCIAIAKLGARSWRGRLHARLPEVQPLDRPDLRFASVDSMVMEAVFWFGVQGYEGMVAAVWERECRQARAILEIGGNVGLFTVIGALATHGTYTVVEPLPAVAAVLADNLQRNRVTRATLRQAAAIPGSTGRIVEIQIPDADRGAPVGAHLGTHTETTGSGTTGSGTTGVGTTDSGTPTIVSVEGIPFRDLVAGKDLIKIDAEGIEAALIEAARDIILECRPTLLIEVLPSSVRLGMALRQLAEAGRYRIEVLPEWGSDKAVPVAPAAFDASVPQRHRSKDVLLIPMARTTAEHAS
jgi:FkbM family methyltransferase